MPFLLFFTLLCIGATFFIADVPPIVGLVLFIVANFAYQAALIYYDATLKTVSYPATRGKLSGIGTGDRLLRDGLRRAADLLPGHPGRRPLPADGDPVPAVRDPDLPVRPRAADRPTSRPLTAAEIRDAFGQLRRSIAHAREVPGPGAVPARPVLLLRRGQHGHRRHERRGREDDGPVRGERQPRPADADARGDRDELRLGLAGATGRARSGRSSGCCISWAVGLVLGGVAIGFGPAGLVPFLIAGAILGQRPRRRPGRRPGADGPAVAARQDRRVLRDLRAGRQGHRRSSASCCTARSSSCCSTRSGTARTRSRC